MRKSSSAAQFSNNVKEEKKFFDKDPFYKTNGMLNGCFNKNMSLKAGTTAMTDCESTIYVDFTGDPDGSYLSLMHEWSHIICKSNPHLWTKFIGMYGKQLVSEGFDICHVPGFDEYMHHLINVFDDLRSNSLLERVYAGSAQEIWDRWKGLCEEIPDINENFPALSMAVFLGANNVDHVNGPFSDLLPIMKEAAEKVQGKGTANMLLIIRWLLDRCVKRLLQPTPPQPQQQQPGGDPKSGDSKDGDTDDTGQGAPAPQGSGDDHDEGEPGDSGGAGGEEDEDKDPQGDADQGKSAKSKTDALNDLASGADHPDKDATHPAPTGADTSAVATRAIVRKALGVDVDQDPEDFDGFVCVGKLDDDMQDAIDKLQSTVRPQNANKFIVTDAKAAISLVDVKPGDVKGSKIELSDEDRAAVQRLRAAFSRVLGRVRAKMEPEGSSVDVQEVIQYLMDPTSEDIFESETITKGFAYMTLCDMSGSMQGVPFAMVNTGCEILNQALDYPFVDGYHWGFRGGDRGAEILLYRYDKKCQGYLGKSRIGGGKYQRWIDVQCGGLTPMNSSLHVAVKYLSTQVAEGMAKRLFLLTDGSPTHVTVKGSWMSGWMLEKFTRQEILNARQKGIEVYTFIIGGGIDDKAAIKMFGPPRFWRRVSYGVSIREALVDIVLSEFIKYLRSK